MGAHAWWSHNMPHFLALLDLRLVGTPPAFHPRAPEGFRLAGAPA